MQERNTILIVDDQETNRAILHRLLEDQFIILEAEDGLEAIEQINGHEKELALIMLDIIMPNMNGYDVLHFMENASIDENIPVILITGDIETIAELKEYQSHIAEVVMKPFDIQITRRRVYHTIELYESKRRELEKEQKTQKAGNATKTFQTTGQLAMEEKQNTISEKPCFEATEKIRLESENLELKDRYALLEKENQKSKEQYAQLEKAYKEYKKAFRFSGLFFGIHQEIMEDKDFEKYLYFSSDKVECYDIEKHKLFEIDYDDFYEVDLSLKQKVVCMLVTTRNQQYFFECKQDARFLQIIDLFEQKKIRYIDRNHFISIKR